MQDSNYDQVDQHEDYNSKIDKQKKGIKNDGATCFIAAVIHLVSPLIYELYNNNNRRFPIEDAYNVLLRKLSASNFLKALKNKSNLYQNVKNHGGDSRDLARVLSYQISSMSERFCMKVDYKCGHEEAEKTEYLMPFANPKKNSMGKHL